VRDPDEPTPRVFENQRTGERVEVISESPELLALSVTWPRPGQRALPHIHPSMEETWHVLSGRAAFVIDGVELELGANEHVVASPGIAHLAWNPTEEPVELRIEMRPARRWAEFTRRLFAREDPARLLAEFGDEIRLALR
jgi:mannose-6-phosphate isomerase-like protein (cupin superfamily)